MFRKNACRLWVGLDLFCYVMCGSVFSFLLILSLSASLAGPELDVPDRETCAPGGSDLVSVWKSMSLQEREDRIFAEFLRGNVPSHLALLVPVQLKSNTDSEAPWEVTFWVTPDFLAIGSDKDFLRIPMTPILAQRLANELDCQLPTPAMVDLIWRSAEQKLNPQPIPPSPAMTTLPVFAQHQLLIDSQLDSWQNIYQPEKLLVGHKKDVVIIPGMESRPNKVFIYGWHLKNGQPIQPVYSGHVIWYADYSHGIRLVHNQCEVNGEPRSLRSVLVDPVIGPKLSGSEKAWSVFEYPTDADLYP